MRDGSLPTTRLSTLLLALAWSKWTPWPAAIEKLCQLRMAPDVLRTVIWPPCVATVAWPCTTWGPVGKTGAGPAACTGRLVSAGLSRQAASRLRASGVSRGTAPRRR